jgi:hypothetical protein
VTLPEVVTANSLTSLAKFRSSTITLTSSSGPLPTRTRRLRRLSHASQLLSHRMWSHHPVSAPRVVPHPQQGPHRGSLFALGLQGARTRVQLGLRRRPRPRFGLQPPLWFLLGLRVQVRLRVGPRGSRVRGKHY